MHDLNSKASISHRKKAKVVIVQLFGKCQFGLYPNLMSDDRIAGRQDRVGIAIT